jgi:hypothetical protein
MPVAGTYTYIVRPATASDQTDRLSGVDGSAALVSGSEAPQSGPRPLTIG